MKWFFFTLLIANLGLFIWIYPQQGGDLSAAGNSQDIGDLRLANEKPRPESEQGLPVVVQSSGSENDLNSSETTEKDLPPEIKPQLPPVGAETAALKLPAEEDLPPGNLQCRSIGVFEKRSQAELLTVQLLALGLKPEISSETSNEQAGYWVLIPPQSNREAAIDIAKRLEEAGVADLWRFTSGNLAHAISLGLFRDLERAQARKDQIGGLGFNTEVRPRYRQQTQYWLNYSFSGDSPITEQKWREFELMFPGIEDGSASCL